MSDPVHEASTRLSLRELDRLVAAALVEAGMSRENAEPVAAGMVACERDGVQGHGVLRLAGFVNSLKTGWADGQSEPQTVSDMPGALCLDAANGFVQPILAHYRPVMIAKARACGVAVLQIRNSHHFAALWPDLEPFVQDGLIAYSCVSSKKRMAAWGGDKAVLGTNAMAFGVPRPDGQPVIWDQSSSVLSQGDILHAAKEGRSVPLGVGIDAAGAATDNPQAILEGGALLPFGGAKGASLAFMVEVLAAGLSGGQFGFQDQSPGQTGTTSRGGYFLLLLDPKVSASDFPTRMADLFQALAQSGTSRLPGDRRYRIRAQSEAEGVVLSDTLYRNLQGLAGQGG